MKSRDVGRIVSAFVAIAIFAYLFLLSNPPWNTHGSALAIESVLAFLAVVTAASALIRTRIDPSPKHMMFVVAIVYMAVIHIGATMDHFYRTEGPVIYAAPAGILLDLVELTTVAVLLFAAYRIREDYLREKPEWSNSAITTLLLIAALAIYGLAYYLGLTAPSSAIVVNTGYAVGVAGLCVYVMLCLVLSRQRVDFSTHDPVRIAMASVLFGVAMVMLLLILPSPSQIWVAAIVCQAAALMFMNIGTGYPFLVDVGVKRWIAYTIIVGISVFVIAPFVATQLIEAFFSFVSHVNIVATVLVHITAALFTSVVGTVLYFRSKNGTSWYHSPVVFLLFSWTILESSIVFFRFYPPYGDQSEPFVPYVIGGLISAVTLVVAVRRILSPPREERPSLSTRLHLGGYISVVAIVALGEIIKSRLFLIYPGLEGGVLGETIMLLTSFVSAFALVSFIMLMATETGVRYSVENVAVASQALWIISIVLRANFSYWTAGWWAAEAVLLIAGIILPLTMTYLYLDKSKEAQEFRRRTRVYSDVVGGDIVDHHTETISLLKKISDEQRTSESDRIILSQAIAGISHASVLTMAVRGLVVGESYSSKDLQATDVIACISLATKRLSRTMPDKRVELKTDCETGKCFVNANSLLADLFHSLFRGLLRRTQATLSITATLTAVFEDSRRMWQIRIGTQAGKSEAKMTRDLFERYLVTDKSEGLDFALVRELARIFLGRVYIESRVCSEELEEITFVIVLPAAEFR